MPITLPPKATKGLKVTVDQINAIRDYARRHGVIADNGFEETFWGVHPPERGRDTHFNPFSPRVYTDDAGVSLYLEIATNGVVFLPEATTGDDQIPAHSAWPQRPQINDSGLKDIDNVTLGRRPRLSLSAGTNMIYLEISKEARQERISGDASLQMLGTATTTHDHGRGTFAAGGDNVTGTSAETSVDVYVPIAETNYHVDAQPELKVAGNSALSSVQATELTEKHPWGVIEVDSTASVLSIDLGESEWYIYHCPFYTMQNHATSLETSASRNPTGPNASPPTVPGIPVNGFVT